MDRRYFAGLDGLRGIFCIGIVLYHISGIFQFAFSKWLNPIYEYGGYLGNYIFFMISGFLIAYAHQVNIREKTYTFACFMKKHLIKVYPAYLLSNITMMLVIKEPLTAPRTASTLLMISNGWFSGTDTPYNFPAWFLCVLFICYGLYFGVGSISRKYPKLYLPLCGAFVIWGMVLEACDWNVPLNYRTCGEGYLNFFLGALLAEIYVRGIGGKHMKIASYVILLSTFAGVCLLGFDRLPGDMRWWISAVCAALVSLAVYEGWAARVLSCRLLHTIGTRSRDIFLWHIPVQQAFVRVVPQYHAESGFLLYLLTLSVWVSLLWLLSRGFRETVKTVSGT